MSLTSYPKEIEPVSKVTFSPINTEALVVSIRTILPNQGENLRMEAPKRRESFDANRRPRTHTHTSEEPIHKSTMTEYRKEISMASQTSVENESPRRSVTGHKISPKTPCLRHAAENISIKATEIPSEKVSLCNNCSKSMLSYIFLVQDFLDSLANEICIGENSQDCAQCLREQVREQIISRADEASKVQTLQAGENSSVRKKSSHLEKYGAESKSSTRKKPNRTKDDRHEKECESKDVRTANSSFTIRGNLQDTYQRRSQHQGVQQKTEYRSHSSAKDQQSCDSSRTQTLHHNQPTNQQLFEDSTLLQNQPTNQQHFVHPNQDNASIPVHRVQEIPLDEANIVKTPPPNVVSRERIFIKPMERQQPNFMDNTLSKDQNVDTGVFHNPESVSSPSGEERNRIVPAFSNAEREVYDAARNDAGWEGMTEVQERLIAPDGRILTEAFVTMCRNNAEALGCLVVGTSLLLSRTSRTLCVLISDGVSLAFREPLSSVFHVVQTVRSLDSLGTTKLALLEQPEIGVSFDKLNIWRLTQFHKCVYLNPDTLVIQNCDELFNHEELSAVPDIGWPDCFNSGVFVFSPSVHTFWQLLEFSEKQGSYDGGDQGLLNSYFTSWSREINNKLSFIYNLMANVSYTYTPAFKQFGRNVKIVQFHGTSKPWHVKFLSQTGEISKASSVHPTYIQFVNRWIKIFQGCALRHLSQEIQSYAVAQKVICAVEVLRFFPLPSESEAEFFLTPPSVRMRLVELKLNRIPKSMDEVKRRKSAEFPRISSEEDSKQEDSSIAELPDSAVVAEVENLTEGFPVAAVAESDTAEEKVAGKVTGDKDTVEDVTKLPGAEVGNYQGMTRWEQGKMDYQGTDSSDSVIKRLEFLMSQQPK